MVNSMVARATSNVLVGPDWAMNLEICDACNRDPAQAKDVIKGIKKRLRSKNPKSQLLTLTLLESIMKNCGDIVHAQVAERKLLHDMVKMVKKKPDYHVKEKILILIDTWQEAFGGSRGRYPQYYAAYHDLLRLGVNFPERPTSLAPVLTPPQTQPITSVPHNLHNPENENERGMHSAEADVPSLSLTEMQNARGIMDVLAEMLAAVDPAKKEGLRQDVIVDLVEQCRTYKKRLVHLVNSTSDESLLSLGLALNDDLQRVLAKHESLLTTTPEKSKSTPETSRALVPVTPPTDSTSSKQPGSTSAANAEPDLISLAPVTTNGQSTPKVNVSFDLLSGDDFDPSPASNALAIVPVSDLPPQHATPVSDQNALALVTVPPQNTSAQQPALYPNRNVAQNQLNQSWAPHNQGNGPMWNGQMAQQQQQQQQVPLTPYNQGNGPMWNGQMSQQQQRQQQPPLSPYNQGNSPMWNGHMAQQQQQQQQLPLPGYGAGINNSLPAPPWEAPPVNTQFLGAGPQYIQPGLQTPGYNNMYINNQMPPMNNQVYTHQMGQQLPQQQMAYMYPQQQMGQQMYNNQMGQVNGYGGYGYGYGFGYTQQQNAQVIKSMQGMSVRDEGYLTSTVYTGPSMANASYVHKPKKTEDALFGDLVDFSKVKPKKT